MSDLTLKFDDLPNTAGNPHFRIKAVPLAEIHQLQVRLKRGVIVEQLGCFNSDV